MAPLTSSDVIAVIGAGTMGAGIAQVAAAAGHRVLLFDTQPGAADKGRDRVAKGLEPLVARGKMAQADAQALVGRIRVAAVLADLQSAALVVEAIVENLAVKRDLFQQLERIVQPEAILATNTSSISVTAIAAALAQPQRVVGMHFFNPAPVMKLVEVVSGLATAPDIAETVLDTARSWGKYPVHAKSSPGFIVNRVARAYYGEPLRLAEEGVADPATLDALMTQGGGFRMGPFALMDLIGNDVNLAVSQSVFDAYHQEPRFRPSLLQRELVEAGRLGRKSGHGFYAYGAGAAVPQQSTDQPGVPGSPWADLDLAKSQKRGTTTIVPTDGRTAEEMARETGGPVIVVDLCATAPGRVGFAVSTEVSPQDRANFVATLVKQGLTSTALPDWPGLVVMRTLALIANEGFEATLQGVATEEAIDAAMMFGVNYPRGPMAWARDLGLDRVLGILDRLHAATGDMRYRASYLLRRQAQPGRSGPSTH